MEHWEREIKKQDYAAHGFEEYWIGNPVKQTVEQHCLEGAEYCLLGIKGVNGTIASFAVSGFAIAVAAVSDADANVTAQADLLR